ncbi:Cell wall-binding protein YwsB [Polaribacter huanghezhanensis]|uniref:SH3 domain-containing protein n=1 Tax=Polaribacter huanghezhanensis TaxID=1354726 RepID=UPI0026471F68|nr:SH3 domain-containing protein [Polaribacter huanghezhanensis]WKD85826.1 Cell wall-binding protein YwsB [Polaribacter huanghezhanensis]
MKKTLFIFLLFNAFLLNAQSAKNYHVKSQNLNVREKPNSKSPIVIKLKRYDNFKIIEEKNSLGWVKITYKSYTGYVHSRYIKKGKVNISYYSVRTGAKCRDGSSSSATGRGACSHHGGVSYWITSKRKSVSVEN